MKNKITFKISDLFSAKLYVQALKKLRIVGIISSVIVILPTVISVIGNLLDTKNRFLQTSSSAFYRDAMLNHRVDIDGYIMMCFFLMILAPIMVNSVFSFLNRRAGSDFYHSLPQKRLCIYNSFILAALTLAIGILFVTFGLVAVLLEASRFYTLNIGDIAKTFAIYSASIIWIMGITVLAKTVTGNRTSNVLAFLVLISGIGSVVGYFNSYLMDITPILCESNEMLQMLSTGESLLGLFVFEILFGVINSNYISSSVFIFAFVTGLVFIILGGVAFHMRRSETATRATSGKITRHILCALLTLPVTMFVLNSIYRKDVLLFKNLVYYIIPVLLFFVVELLTSKNIIKALKAMPVFLIVVLSGVMVFSSAELTSFAVNANVPTAEEIKSVTVNLQKNDYEYGEVTQYQIVFTTPDEIEFFTEKLKDTASLDLEEYGYEQYYNLTWIKNATFTYTNGKNIARNICFTEKTDYELYQEMLELHPQTIFYNEGEPKSIKKVVFGDLKTDEDDELFKTFMDEYSSLSIDDKRTVYSNFKKHMYNSTPSVKVYFENYSEPIYFALHSDQLPKTTTMWLERSESPAKPDDTLNLAGVDYSLYRFNMVLHTKKNNELAA